jgi:ABC-type sugar transport system ATPase subunit
VGRGEASAAKDAAAGDQRAAAPLFALRGVTKRFGGVTAVEDVSFDLRAGEVHALVGENGAGKSTLMKIVNGLYAPDDGAFEVDGAEVTFHSPRDAEATGIAMIPQELDVFPELTAAENLFVGRPRPRTGWRGLDWASMREEAERRLASLGVELDVGLPVRMLSTANRQIVLIARALIGDARAVIMDEPTASLTEREADRLFDIVDELTSRGVGVVYISHRLGEVFRVSDRITVMRDGHHIRTAPASELDPEELVRLMVGRTLKELFTRTEAEAGDVALELRGLTRAGEFADVDLQVRRGEVVGLAGLIGAGRTELAQTVFGARRADAGEIRVLGRVVRPASPGEAMEHGIVYVPEERLSQGLVLPFTIAANITLSVLERLTRLGLVSRPAERDTARRFSKELGIRGARISEPANRLSGGNQQKVVLAKSLAREPQVLLLDEPTRGVDVGAKSEIYRIIDGLAREGKAIVLISSELEEVLSMSDRVVVMREGRVTAELPRERATQERVMAAATGVEERAA